ncbi:unnamed protein product, partial [Ceratitis capitata]
LREGKSNFIMTADPSRGRTLRFMGSCKVPRRSDVFGPKFVQRSDSFLAQWVCNRQNCYVWEEE